MSRNKSNLPGLLLILGFVWFLTLIFGGGDDSSFEKRAPSASSMRIEAFVKSQSYVKSYLKSPASADFPVVGDSHTVITGAGNYLTNSYVDAQNGFGAMTRTRYYCELEYNEENHNWKLLSLVFPEQNKVIVNNHPKPEPFKASDRLPDPPAEKEPPAPLGPNDKSDELKVMCFYKLRAHPDKTIILYSKTGSHNRFSKFLDKRGGVIEIIDKRPLDDNHPNNIWYNIKDYQSYRRDKKTGEISFGRAEIGWIAAADIPFERVELFH